MHSPGIWHIFSYFYYLEYWNKSVKKDTAIYGIGKILQMDMMQQYIITFMQKKKCMPTSKNKGKKSSGKESPEKNRKRKKIK